LVDDAEAMTKFCPIHPATESEESPSLENSRESYVQRAIDVLPPKVGELLEPTSTAMLE